MFDAGVVVGVGTELSSAVAGGVVVEDKKVPRESVDIKEVRGSYESVTERSQYDSLVGGSESFENVYQSDFLFWMVSWLLCRHSVSGP